LILKFGNDFWKMMEAALGQSFENLTYKAKIEILRAHHIGLWDAFHNRAGRDGLKAMEKFEHGEKVIEAQKRIAVPRQLLHYGQVDGR
jgi:G:T/U-mismatch repair DNA glycosylase